MENKETDRKIIGHTEEKQPIYYYPLIDEIIYEATKGVK